jgi:hypothetical protein
VSVTHGATVGQGALALDGTQLDLFDVLAADGGEASAWGAPAPSGTSEPEPLALRGSDSALSTQGIDRFLLSEAFTAGAELDRASAPLTDVRLHVEVRLPGAGHVLTVAAAVEREIRRRESVTSATAGPLSDGALAGAIAAAQPLSSGPSGLAVAGAGGSAAALMLAFQPADPAATPLARWPRLALALAASAVADRGFRLADGSSPQLVVDLVRPRSRAVAGGLPDEAVTMILVGRQAGATRQVRVVTTGEPRPA